MEETKKPKKQLTEAQRLAFLEGRKKRMANIEKKKQEKEEEEAKKQEENTIETQIEPPERCPTPPPPSITPVMDPDATAQKIADFVLDKIRAIKEEERKMNQEVVPLPKPRKPRQPRKKSISPPLTPVKDEPKIEQPIPQRIFNWM